MNSVILGIKKQYILKMSYSQLSRDLTKSLAKIDKKNQGIYFTPPKTTMKIIEYVKYIVTGTNLKILEPSCGSGEFIFRLKDAFPDSSITAIEKNDKIFNEIESMCTNKMTILNEDYLKYEGNTKYSLIIGNPPYFVMKKGDVDKKYHPYFEGRPNIFTLFILKALDELEVNGVLCFVLPKSFLNCLYYNKTRSMIYHKYEIINVMNCDDDSYIETNQETFALLLKKTDKFNNDRYTLKMGEFVVFGEEKNIEEMKNLKENSTTLNECMFNVKVGNVVWNQCKSILTDDTSKTRLIYSSDIVGHKLTQKKYKNNEKKHFIEKDGDSSPLLVVNRGYGSGPYKFEYCLIEGGFDYLIENHLICIKDCDAREKDELIMMYKRLIESLKDTRTMKFIELYCGNSAINTTELKYIVPFYLI